MKILHLCAIAVAFFAAPEWSIAVCTGPSPTWTCGSTYAEINSLINANSPPGFTRNDTVTVTASSSSWANTLVLTKGVKLKGVDRNSVTVTSSVSMIQIDPDSTTRTNQDIIEVSGFTFNGNATATHFVEINGPSTEPITRKVLIHDNKFMNSSLGSGNFQAAIYVVGQVRGVIHSNIFDRCNVIFVSLGNDTFAPEWSTFGPLRQFGIDDNIFFEDNTIQYSSSFSGSDPGWTESGHAGRFIARYNTWNMTNSTMQEIWDIHGSQYNPGGQAGTMISEYYGNTLTGTTGYRWIHMRGGWGLFFNNILTGSGGGNQVSDYDGSCDTITGYPTQIDNTYFWNNTSAGSTDGASVLQNNCAGTKPLTENVRFWNQNASCTRTSCLAGIGRDTTAPTGLCAIGTGFWVASTSTATVSSSVIQNASFYKCTATNVWTLYYRPYTYPHPLRSGADITPPAAPTNLRFAAK